MKKILGLKIFLILLILPACTGTQLSTPSVDSGGLVITPGDKLTVDLQDVVNLNMTPYTVTLQSMPPDFSVGTQLYDLTSYAQSQLSSNSTSAFQFILPKEVTAAKPYLIVVDFPIQSTQLIDVIFDGQLYVRPGLASTYTFNLMKNYALPDASGNKIIVKKLTDYSSSDFGGIKNLVQARIDYLTSTSEHLSYSTTPWKKLDRYFKNGLAFNIDFLKAIRPYGINYTFDTTTPPGLVALQTPENDLTNYQYASVFYINGTQAACNPLDQNNTPPHMMPGGASPNPAEGIYIGEGSKISVTAQGYDPEDDFIDKDMIIQYVPRVLPPNLSARIIPEPTPFYKVNTNMSLPASQDVYTADSTIGYNEALDLSFYVDDGNIPRNVPLYGDTAYQNIYYLITDGMMVIPYRWNFKYADQNRSPVIVQDANGNINDTYFDYELSHNESHPISICESDINTAIHGRPDGPWSCVFKVIDQDLDQDPNAAPDVFNYTVGDISNSAEAHSGIPGNVIPSIWPPISPYTISIPKRVRGTILPTCTTPDHVTHFKCGVGIVQITVDNSLKAVAEAKADLTFPYSIVVYDRDNTNGQNLLGMSQTHPIQRIVKFDINPPHIINFEALNPSTAISDLSTQIPDTVNGGMMVAPFRYATSIAETTAFTRWDAYLSDLGTIQAITNTFSSTDPTTGNPLSLLRQGAGSDSARKFLYGKTTTDLSGNPVKVQISPYITQPRKVVTSFDSNTLFLTGTSSGALNSPSILLGNNLASTSTAVNATDQTTYSHPREYDSACSINTNNQDLLGTQSVLSPNDPWNQVASTTPVGNAGWVFEINAIDYDNMGLNLREPTDPVYIHMSNDVLTAINSAGFSYCTYPSPNMNALTYETYQSIPATATTSALPAVDPDYCSWSSTPPTFMQPVPVYYQTTDNNIITVNKFVYHRLRMKWAPKDQSIYPLGKTYTQLKGFLQNVISGLSLNGNRYFLDHSILRDQTVVPINLNLFAERKDMQACIVEKKDATDANSPYWPKNTRVDKISSATPPSSFPLQFSVNDQNKTLGTSPSYLGPALAGRFEAELTVKGTRSILSQNFQQWLPYIQDCTTTDGIGTTIPSLSYTSWTAGATPTPIPQIKPMAPAVFYSRADDGDNIPRMRLRSSSVDIINGTPSGSGGDFCVNHQFIALKNGTTPYDEVLVLENKNLVTRFIFDPSVAVGLTNGGTACTGFPAPFWVEPDQRYIVFAGSCGSTATHSTALINSLALDTDPAHGNYIITVGSIFSPAAYGLSSLTPYNFDFLPSLYGATPVLPLSASDDVSFSKQNVLYYDLAPIETFSYDAVGTQMPKYTGYNSAMPTSLNSANLGLNPMAMPSPAGYVPLPIYGVQYTGVDHQPTDMALVMAVATPTPDSSTNVYYRSVNNTKVQLFIKNHASATVGIKVADIPFDTLGTPEHDPYDIMQYALVPPTATPASTPFYSNIGTRSGGNCTDAPVTYDGYPSSLYTLAISDLKVFIPQLADFKACNFNWTPNVTDNHDGTFTYKDDGKRFTYTISVQDNFGATAVPLTKGVGAQTAKNGPIDNLFYIDFESLETNSPPYFTTTSAGGTTINSAYAADGTGPGWSSVFTAGNGTAGVQPDHSTCNTSSEPAGFDCSLSIAPGDVLQSSTAIPLIESTQQSFNVFAADSNITTALKTLSGSAPSSVLIVDGPHKGETYTLPTTAAFSGFSGGGIGTSSFNFLWTPTDSEANYLSNTSGFLIPVTVSDQQYKADSTIPSSFVTQAMSSRIWIWAKLSVKNNSPVVYSVTPATPGTGGTETQLSGSTLTVETGSTTSIKIRVKDSDVARWTQSNVYTGFTPTAGTGFYNSFTGKSGSNFVTVTPAATPYASLLTTPTYIGQDLFITVSPVDADIGSYVTPSISISDPGDPSLGLAINPDGNSPPNAMLTPSNAINAPFTIKVVGKPVFLNPTALLGPADFPHVDAYATKPFTYPTSLSISRPAEIGQPMFVGIDYSTIPAWAATDITNFPSRPTLKTSITIAASTGQPYVPGTGLYVNENNILKWPDSSSDNEVYNNSTATYLERVVPLVAVLKSRCTYATFNTLGTPNPGTGKILIRYNESLNKMETCTLVANDVSQNSTLQNLGVSLLDPSLVPGYPVISQTELDRSFTPGVADTGVILNQQFAEFEARCAYCAYGPNQSSGSSPSGLVLGATNTSGYATYKSNSYIAKFTFNNSDNTSFNITKSYTDSAPTSSAGRTINVIAGKGETLTFTAALTNVSTLDSSPYRWYVNGCLKASGKVTSGSPTISFNYLLSSVASGANNDCSGENSITEANAGALGQLIVRLYVMDGTYTESSTHSYVYNVTVLNTDPNIQTLTTYTPAAPVNLTTLTGDSDIQFAMPIGALNKNYFSFTDLNSVTGLKVKFREFTVNGDLLGTDALTLNNNNNKFTTQPAWIGINAVNNGITISASTVIPNASSNPITPGNSAASFGATTNSCYNTTLLNLSTTSLTSPTYQSGGTTTPASLILGSNNLMATNSSAIFIDSSNNNKPYMLTEYIAQASFWSVAMTSIYSSVPTPLSNTYLNNKIRKNIISGNKNFELIGAKSSGQPNWKGFIIMNSLSGSSTGILSANTSGQISFASPADSAKDCAFEGTPLVESIILLMIRFMYWHTGMTYLAKDTLFRSVMHPQLLNVLWLQTL